MPDTEKGYVHQKTSIIEWKIENFFSDCKEVGDSYSSPLVAIVYETEATEWYLKVYPNGTNEENKDYVSLFVYFQSDDISEVTVDYNLSILCEQNNIFKGSQAKKFTTETRSWGWPQFTKHDVIKDAKNGALIDDTLTISCKITFVQNTKIINYDEWLGKMQKGFVEYETLLDNNCFSDVTFNIQDKKMYAHKNILSCRNSVFKAMFEHEMRENKESTVEITDIEYNAMKELFRFIYCGKVENIETIAKDLLIAADKYCVIELKAMCEKTLYDSLKVDNAIECLKLTQMCDTLHLKKLVIKFVVDNLKDIVPKCDFKLLFTELHGDVVCAIMQAVAEKD